jgi:hypothetical protein
MHVASSIALWSYQKESRGPLQFGTITTCTHPNKHINLLKNREMGLFVIGPRILNLL